MGEQTRFSLKWIAVWTMILDHGMKLFAEPMLQWMQACFGSAAAAEMLYCLLLSFGRIAFLIFGFQIAEGVHYTKNPSAYLLRLAAIGIVSEVPYQMMSSLILSGEVSVGLGLTNVCWTLLLGAASCMAHRRMEGIWKGAAMLLFAWIVAWLGTDYGAYGVCYIYICYIFFWTGWRKWAVWLAMLWMYMLWIPVSLWSTYGMTAASCYEAAMYLLGGCMGAGLICNYHGKRGYADSPYVFYAVYPLHMVCLLGIYMGLEYL